jgi:hypothetical protein
LNQVVHYSLSNVSIEIDSSQLGFVVIGLFPISADSMVFGNVMLRIALPAARNQTFARYIHKYDRYSGLIHTLAAACSPLVYPRDVFFRQRKTGYVQ